MAAALRRPHAASLCRRLSLSPPRPPAAGRYACDKIRMGAERKSAHISADNLRTTAYHEGGHALVALHTKGAMPIHKATIVPRGMALGMVRATHGRRRSRPRPRPRREAPRLRAARPRAALRPNLLLLLLLHSRSPPPPVPPCCACAAQVSYLPEKDQMNMSREQMLATLDVAMGGRIAEEIIFGKQQVTTGAQGDLAAATNIARNMVTRYGMSEALGPIYAPDEEARLLAPATRELIDKEVQRMLEVRRHRRCCCACPAAPPSALRLSSHAACTRPPLRPN